ncbi:TCF3 fusion partner isoform X2 [Alligator mississippiensis]|uniref:TCF3 fusion partner n=1 Tax=Alligator mississippiensis TaxID=8496 RepID=A0A151M520_ALLMI|nr:TCF3 fusion partner isoform X2 [Alligator mississippiensis]KYO19520.1 TCF3 fusion partner [Alligator mississippiensis]
MAGVGFEEFSAPPGSELALPPLFGGNILESELETEVEFVDGGLSGDALPEDEEEEALQRQRELGRRKVQALGRRCREIEQVNERVLNRLHHVQKITRRLKQERRFLMKILDSYGDDYRQSQLTIVLEDEGSHSTDVPTPGNTENEPPEKETLQRFPGPPPTGLEPESPSPAEAPSGKKRRRHGREDKEQRGRRTAPSLLTMDDFPVQVKAEDDFPCSQDDVLDPSWNQPSPPDKMLHYPKFSSPGGCSDFD